MNRTILMAGLLAGLAGTAVLAQTATTPEADATAPAVETTPESAPAAPEGMPMHDGEMRREAGRVPNMAPLALAFYDTDGDGLITPEEIEARKAARFAAADADGDGGLTPEELVSLEDAIRAEARAAQAEAQVARFDDNGDGLLQAEEIEARTPRLAPVFDRLDTDGDGAVSEAELQALGEGRGEHGGRHARGPRGGEGPGWGWGMLPGLLGD